MYLPSAPNDSEKHFYLNSGRFRLYSLSAISTVILLVGMVLFVKTNPYFIPYTLFSIATIFYLSISYAIGILGRDFDFKKHRHLLTKYFDRASSEKVDILLPICGEPIELLANTWAHVKKLQESHEGKCIVYVLDDKKDVKAASLADKMHFQYIARPTNELKKAGNLRYAFSRTFAPFFVVFDADFCPRRDFLVNTLPYFYENEKVGIVQTPQFFEVTKDQTLIQQGAGSIQELFYRLIQTNRDAFNGAICVGSNAVYSRKHLEPFGGTAAIGYSEDVRTGFRLTQAGGIVRYIPINLAKGTCPEDWKQFFTQYYRWAMGSLDLMFSREFWEPGLTFAQKICYLTGMFYYLTTGLSVLFYFIPSVYLLTLKPELIHWYNLLFSLPSFFLSTVYMRYWQKLPYNMTTIRVRHMANYAHLFALKDRIMNTLEEWKPTNTVVKSKRYESFCGLYIWLTLLVPGVTVGLVLTRVYEGYPFYNFALLLFFTGWNLFVGLPIIRKL